MNTKQAMMGAKLCGDSNINVLLQTEKFPCSPEVLESLWIATGTSPSSLRGSKSMVNFDNVNGGEAIDAPFYQPVDREGNVEEDYDGSSNPPAKKRRLTVSQVQFLERNFEVENKLEPERKVQLAKELGLQPRQVAIWFQNRRARFKNKQLEKDYDSLKASYDKLKADYENLLKENENLKNEILQLKERSLIQEREKETLDPPTAIKSSDEGTENPTGNAVSENFCSAPMVACKQEDASSAGSDVFDSDSPHYTDGNHCSLIEPADSSHVFEPDQSDFSQDEEDDLQKTLLQPPCFPKLEGDCYHGPSANSCNLGFSVDDQPFWSWLY